MLVVTALGSCRVTNPVRKAVGSYPILLNNARVYGYVHSSAELVQQIRFLRRDFSIPDTLRPLIAPHVEKGLHEAAHHRSSDIYIAEISSSKVVRVGETCVQWNHVSRHFAGFFADAGRARLFWSLAKGDTEDEKQRFLDRDPAFATLSHADRHLLRGLTMQIADAASLRADIRSIMAELPRVLFVTHCNALLPDGKPIPGRDRFISALTDALQDCDADYCNPTSLMREFGQSTALLDESGSLAHYTDAFERALFAHWHNSVLAPPAPLAMAG